MHHVIQPLALIHATIRPFINSVARYLVLYKASLILLPIHEFKATFSMLKILNELSFVDWAISWDFLSIAMLPVIKPLSIICRSIWVSIKSYTIRFAFDEFPNIIISICMNKSAFSMKHAIIEVTFIEWAIKPHLLSSALSFRALQIPFSFIYWLVRDSNRRHHYFSELVNFIFTKMLLIKIVHS